MTDFSSTSSRHATLACMRSYTHKHTNVCDDWLRVLFMFSRSRSLALARCGVCVCVCMQARARSPCPSPHIRPPAPLSTHPPSTAETNPALALAERVAKDSVITQPLYRKNQLFTLCENGFFEKREQLWQNGRRPKGLSD